MATATLVLDDVPGFQGRGAARLYRLSVPLIYDGREFDHVVVWVQYPTARRDAWVSVIMATRRGMPAEGSMRERPGSYPAHGNPHASPEALEGAFAWALATAWQAGPDPDGEHGYTIVNDPGAA